jgi:EF hand
MDDLSRVVPMALAVALGTGASLSGPAAAQELQYACDENGDRFVDASESRSCTEREFDELAGGEEVLTEEQLSAMSQGERGMMFSEVDDNGDGEISREEWTEWHDQRFTAVIQTGESGIPVADYESRQWLIEGYARPMPEDAGQNRQ